MPISTRPGHYEMVGGTRRRLCLRVEEIERFEDQFAPLGIFDVYDGLLGRGRMPQARHVRDLVALALVGGGMSDRDADALIAGLPTSEYLALRDIARRAIGVAFMPDILTADTKKKSGGSPEGSAPDGTAAAVDTMPGTGSRKSAV